MNQVLRIMEQIRKQKVQVLLGLLFFSFFVNVSCVSAQTARSYSYDGINFEIHINKDTTVDVIEYEGFNFIGEYHQGWRNIPKKGVDDLSDVSVIDGDTGKSLVFSPIRLEKTNPQSWGRYTTFFENGEYIIEWYFNAKDIRRTYELRYTLHGAISFYKDHDELYWNLFTNYSVPILHAGAVVILPQAVAAENLQAALYVHPLPTNKENAKWQVYPLDASGERWAYGFEYESIPAGADMTIAPGWPKGVVEQSAYWGYWLGRNWGYVGAGVVAILTVIILILRWYFTERYRAGRGLVIPEYEPPKDLPPAMADVLVHENLSSKAWAATVIDLAIRGYIKIEEKKKEKLEVFFAIFMQTVLWFVYGGMFVLVFPSFFQESPSWESRSLILLVMVVIFFRPLLSFWSVLMRKTPPSSFLSKTDYVLIRMTDVNIEDKPLHDYEKEFLDTIFDYSGLFDMKEIRSDLVRGKELYKGLQKLKKELMMEIIQDTDAYAVGFRAWEISRIVFMVAGGMIFWGLFISASVSNHGFITFSLVTGYCFLVLFLFFRYNPRLNKQGQIFREEWLGFKLYLETAEKNRMQNLTPEIFEKYLPYAIIFGVEKKWGKAFGDIAMPQPTWYSGSAMGTGTSLTSSGGFSASAFSSSFSSSFSSAFSSAGGGGGASGGGGGAGGGGGGGGGGAS